MNNTNPVQEIYTLLMKKMNDGNKIVSMLKLVRPWNEKKMMLFVNKT